MEADQKSGLGSTGIYGVSQFFRYFYELCSLMITQRRQFLGVMKFTHGVSVYRDSLIKHHQCLIASVLSGVKTKYHSYSI
jgi:hypothetical protein